MLQCKYKTLSLIFGIGLSFSLTATLIAQRSQASNNPVVLAQLKVTGTDPRLQAIESGIRVYSNGKVTQYSILPQQNTDPITQEVTLLKVAKKLAPKLKKLVAKANPDELKQENLAAAPCEVGPVVSFQITKEDGSEEEIGAVKSCLNYVPSNHDTASIEIRNILEALNTVQTGN